MKPKHLLMIIGFSCAFLNACNKSNNNSPVKQKLLAGLWKISASSLTYTYNGRDTTTDDYSRWPPCEQDDLLMFSADGTGMGNENTEKCREDRQVTSFKWELSDNETQLKLTTGDGTVISSGTHTSIAEILEITDAHLKVKGIDSSTSWHAVYIETYTNIRH